MKTQITVLIADDHEVVRTGLATVIDYEDGLKVVGVAKNGQLALRLASELKPTVIVMDLVMPVMGGVEATEKIRAASPDSRILILTSFGTPDDLRAAQAAGAHGILMKSSSNRDIIRAIRRLAKGEDVLPPDVAQLLSVAEPLVELSPRQKEIIISLSRGLSNREIAIQLGVSRACVKKDLIFLFEKLGVGARAEAVAIALRKHLLKI